MLLIAHNVISQMEDETFQTNKLWAFLIANTLSLQTLLSNKMSHFYQDRYNWRYCRANFGDETVWSNPCGYLF